MKLQLLSDLHLALGRQGEDWAPSIALATGAKAAQCTRFTAAAVEPVDQEPLEADPPSMTGVIGHPMSGHRKGAHPREPVRAPAQRQRYLKSCCTQGRSAVRARTRNQSRNQGAPGGRVPTDGRSAAMRSSPATE